MRSLFGKCVYDSDKADFVGFMLRSSGTVKESMYRTKNGRFFLLIAELDSSPVHQRIVPVSVGEYNQWIQSNQSILNIDPDVKPMPLVTSFLFNMQKTIDTTKDLQLLFGAINYARP